MAHLNAKKTALTVGLFVGGLHAAWSLLVVLGWAQPLIDFILWAHMVHIIYIVGPFDLTACVMLLIVTTAMGAVFGWLFAMLWNALYRGNIN